mgnify:CR=1 FL=1
MKLFHTKIKPTDSTSLSYLNYVSAIASLYAKLRLYKDSADEKKSHGASLYS